MIEQLLRIPAAIALYVTGRIATQKLGNRLERLPRTNLLFSFLIELGSDVRNWGKGLALLIAIALPAISLWGWLLEPITRILSSYLIVVAAVAAIVFLNATEHWAIAHLDPNVSQRDRQFALTMYPLIANLCKYIVYFVALLFMCGTWGVDLLPLLGGISLATLIFGFGAQSQIDNFAQGIFLIFERLFYAQSKVDIMFPDDELVISGTVEKITWRITYIREESGAIVAINNRHLQIVRVIKK